MHADALHKEYNYAYSKLLFGVYRVYNTIHQMRAYYKYNHALGSYLILNVP